VMFAVALSCPVLLTVYSDGLDCPALFEDTSFTEAVTVYSWT
jgi:hypothetical protein